MSTYWPKQRRLIDQLRRVLQRDFGAQDAWIVRMPGQCRLDVRISGRQITLLEDAEDVFWARFYESVSRERVRLGERYVDTQQWRRNPEELSAVLMPFWLARVGPRSSGSARLPGLGRSK